INSRDSKAGKIFSLIHEYIHVLFEQEDVFSNRDIDELKGYERRINSITAEFLMPQEHISRFWQKDKNILDQLNELSKDFKVSKLALVIKLKDMNLVDSEIVEQVKRDSVQNFESNETSSDGGNFYTTLKTRISPTFAKAVIRNAEAGEISYTYAFRLLGGIKGKTYEQLKESLLYYE
ncbi:MAG: ImmA/IrrE family metallo-endopeptidase, partial [Tissierellia bacterium]|nr:ImmA/IrrE family metallo-endopeptidase [Tissierellia bacterium]